MCLIENQNPPEIKFLFSSEIMGELDEHTYIITANQRLSRFRMQQYEKRQLQQGKTAWKTPSILPWHAWLQQQWLAFNIGVLLQPQQESLLWQQVIAEDENYQVLHVKALAKQAMEAWQIIADYHIDPSCLTHSGEEHLALWRWAKAVQERVQSLGKNINHYQKHQQLSQLSQQNMQNTTKTIILDGFDTFSPAQYAYFKHLQQHQYQIYQSVSDSVTAQVDGLVYQDEEEEIRQTCQIIRRYVRQHPTHQIAVLIPDLEHRATQVSRLLREELAPILSLKSQTAEQGDYFNISIGSPLAKQPMIQSALNILGLTKNKTFTYQEITNLLCSPYISGYHEELHQRAQFDAELRRHNHDQQTRQQLLNNALNSTIQLPLWQHYLQIIHQRVVGEQQFSGKKSLSDWMFVVESLLKSLTWHEQAKSDDEQAQVKNWHDLMSQLSALDDFSPLLSWHEALSRLQEQAFEHPFRPAPSFANIQVMGLLEAVHLEFDHAFVLGMDDQTWPPVAKPHPLIPVSIQAQYQTPHANNEREWVFSQSVWQHILHISPTLTISYAQVREQQDVQPSPLLPAFKQQQATQQTHSSSRYASTLQQNPIHVETIKDTTLRLTSPEKVRGGTSILASQAACAFQAFAKHRLRLKALENPSLGLNPAEQGKLLHAALERFWQQNTTHHQLLEHIKLNTLHTTIQDCIQYAWTSVSSHYPDIKRLETIRLQDLLYRWLMLESTRLPFQVKEVESKRSLTLGDKTTLQLHTRLDRIDQDKDGNHIIIDYKTGTCEAKDTLGDRPHAPQLPAYLFAEEDMNIATDGLVYAQVRNDALSFKGFLRENTCLPNFKTAKGQAKTAEHWQTLVSDWRETLNTLADDFMLGEMDVQPKNALSCRYCDFSGICRIESQGKG